MDATLLVSTLAGTVTEVAPAARLSIRVTFTSAASSKSTDVPAGCCRCRGPTDGGHRRAGIATTEGALGGGRETARALERHQLRPGRDVDPVSVAKREPETTPRSRGAGAARETDLRIGRGVSRGLREAHVASGGDKRIVEPIADDVGTRVRVVEDANEAVAMGAVRRAARGGARTDELDRAGDAAAGPCRRRPCPSCPRRRRPRRAAGARGRPPVPPAPCRPRRCRPSPDAAPPPVPELLAPPLPVPVPFVPAPLPPPDPLDPAVLAAHPPVTSASAQSATNDKRTQCP